MHILVVGCGSIGKRHIKNIKFLNVDKISICDLNSERVKDAGDQFDIDSRFTDLNKALAQKGIDAAIICVPTSYHIEVAAKVAKKGIHIFMEKPLAKDMKGVGRLIKICKEKKITFMVAYMFRFHPGLKQVRELILGGKIGSVYGARLECGQYLPDWHPWEDYRSFYMSKEKEGGGALLDISHEFDYLCYLIDSEVAEVAGFCDTLGTLEMDADNISSTIIRFKNRVVASVHLDLLQRGVRRNCQIIGEKGTIIWDVINKNIKFYSAQKKAWEEFTYEYDGNQAYIEEMRHFFQCIKERKKPLVDIERAKSVLEIVLASKKSSRESKVIKFK